MKSKKTNLRLSLIVGCSVALAALIVYLATRTETELSLIVLEFTQYLCCICLSLFAILPFTGIALLTLIFLDRTAVRTFFHLAAHRISARIAAKNAAQIYPCLQHFLYFVLSQNREFLHLPLGRDASCLVPHGYAPAYRSGCVFYRFQLIAPEKPEQDAAVFRLMVQNYINAELQSHGIIGLPSVFQSVAVGNVLSVYLDRVYFDEGQHYLTFDLLFVGNEESARYVRDAALREAAPKQTACEVSDDDLE